ncbi:hypothetical protein AB1Y20_007345 [Prymnesium parvum]|uniref:Amidase domain-containing protein n=1 Tax=Prymnesium parvum TaxID=97485 RepID=A0AB34IWY3_PRYPA
MASCLAFCAFLALLVALILGAAPLLVGIPALPHPPPPEVNLTSPAYDLQQIHAPSATGAPLRALAAVFRHSLLGPLLARLLLDNNEAWRLRELAQQVPESVVHAPLPIRRLDETSRRRHARLAREAPAARANGAAARRRWRRAPPAPAPPPARWSVREYHAAYGAATTPRQVVEALLAARRRIEAAVGVVFTEVHEEELRAAADASTARWAARAPLSLWDGVPVAVKECVDVRGHAPAHGSFRAPNGSVAASDDPTAAALRAAGALIVGTTAMTEWGVTPLGWSVHARGVANPHRTSHYPGGSSSGSAVAVATGLVPMAVGFDGGGSVRIPAALSGVHGLAATFGRIPFRFGGMSSMFHAGPLGATPADVALAYLLLAHAPTEETHTSSHAYGGGAPPPAHAHGWEACADLKGTRLGVFAPHFADASGEVAAAAEAAVGRLVARGATLVPIAIPNLRALSLAHGLAISTEFAASYDRQATNGWPVEPATAITLALGRVVSAAEVHAANRLRSWAMEWVGRLFEEQAIDAIVTPTTGRTAPPLSAAAREGGESNTAEVVGLMKHVFLANLLGLPAVSVPVGMGNESGLPVGLQLMGAWWEEAKLLRLSCAVEKDAHASPTPRPAHFFDELDQLLGAGGAS